MQVPSNMLITKVKPGIYMSAWMLVWAVVSGTMALILFEASWVNQITGCTALVQNYAGLVVCRLFLGITEAPVSILVFLGSPL